jgi:hypothetical protein
MAYGTACVNNLAEIDHTQRHIDEQRRKKLVG